MKQSLTLSIDQELLKKTKRIAAKKQTSVSRLLTEQFAKIVSEDDQYDFARRRALTILRKGFHLGGRIRAKREDLHE